MENFVVDCTTNRDDFGRTIPPSGLLRTMSAQEESDRSTSQTALDASQSAIATAEAQRAADLETVCAAGRLVGGGTFAALCRLMGGTV